MHNKLGDFTSTPRMIVISGLAIVIGLISAFVALALLKLIGFFTNLFFFGHWSAALVSPAGNHLGWWEILVPVAGALIIGVMARYGSERIRGHGIPEAIEAILIGGSSIEPKVAILKPLSSRALHRHRRPVWRRRPHHHDRRRIRLHDRAVFQPHQQPSARRCWWPGRRRGMSATFAAPVAAMLLAVELLLFEWKPRSLIPVALASATAGAARRYLIGLGPLFPGAGAPGIHRPARAHGLCGLRASRRARLSALLTLARLRGRGRLSPSCPFTGCGGRPSAAWRSGWAALIFPQALGVGYDTIGALLQGDVPLNMICWAFCW